MADLLQCHSSALDSWGDWDHHPVLPSDETNYIGIGWPWDAASPNLAIYGITEAEQRTVTTFDDATPTDDTGWEAGSPFASFTDYTGLPGNIATVTVTARYKIGLEFTASYGSSFPTAQTVTIKWSEWERDDLSEYVSQDALEEEFTLSAGTSVVETGWNNIAAPATSLYTRGVGGAMVNPRALTLINLEGATRRKRGFYEYTRPSTPPEVYARETATGRLDGCGDDDAEDYGGKQEYAADGTLTTDMTEDAIEREYLSGERGQSWPDLPAIGRQTSGRDLSFHCAADGEPKEGEITLTLSNPVITETIVDYVDGNSAPSGGATLGGEYYSPKTIGYSFMAEDETIAMRGNSEYLLGVDLLDFEEPEDGATIGVDYTLIVIAMDDGFETVSATGTGITYTSPDPPNEATDHITSATGNNWLWICRMAVSTDPVCAHNSILLCAASTAAIAY